MPTSPANPKVDAYLARSHQWPDEVAALRAVLRGTGLTEELKWGKPCYAADGNNVAIVQEMKPFVALMFFKGALLADPDSVLEDQGPNSHSAKRMTFTSTAQVRKAAPTIRRFVDEAIAVETTGVKVPKAKTPELVAELQARLAADAAFRKAFTALTPGRQREYNLHFADAKQSAIRIGRIDKCADRILQGKGLRDR